MPCFDILKTTDALPTFRVAGVKAMMDLESSRVEHHFSGNIDIEDKAWNVGLIVGASGSGKSTIARECFGLAAPAVFEAASVIDDMPQNCDTKAIMAMFSGVGFGTVPSWLKPFSCLSSGEQMRVSLAREILSGKELIVFDEFTSVVDRNVAASMSFAVQKYVRKHALKFVAVSCHRDVIDWLSPDWVYDTDEREFFFAPVNTADLKSFWNSERSRRTTRLTSGRVLSICII